MYSALTVYATFLQNARSIDAFPVEEAKLLTLIEEIEEACKDIEMDSAMCKGDQLEGHLSHNACMSSFIEILQEPKFQVLESEYHLSRRLSLVDMVIIPATTGQMGVLPGHVATISELKPGVLSVHEGNDVTKYFVSGGLAFVHSNSFADIIAVEAVPLDRIDPNLVQKGLAEFTQKLGTASTDVEKAEAQIGVDVHRALNAALTAFCIRFGCILVLVSSYLFEPDQVWHLEKNEKVIVELNGDGKGSDNGSNLLVRFLGKLSQNSTICPISVERWDRMPEANSRQQWQYIEDNFEFDYVAGIKWVMHTLGERWRAYKYQLRNKYFYPNKRKEDILANPPSAVDSTDWTAFVHHYKGEKMKAQSLQNTTNRKKLKVTHAGGSMSNARRGRQMEKKLGRPVCRSEVVLSTLLKKNGNYVNEEGKIIADKILEHLPQDQEHASSSGVLLKIMAHPNDAIGKVFGAEHSGRVRGLGSSICPSTAFGIRRNFTTHVSFGGSSNNMSQERVEDLEKEVETLKDKLTGYEETKQQLVENNAQLVRAQNQLTTLHMFLQAKFGNELPALN